jgi:hypothetical protein
MYKKIRMDWINEDIENSLFYEDEYKEIKNSYLAAETEKEWEQAIADHDKLNEEEAGTLLKMAAAIKRIKLNGKKIGGKTN